jgi:hypothetical protein
VTILGGLLFLAASARRRRRQRRRITSAGLFLALVTFYSGVNGEVAESYTGVGAWSAWFRWLFSSWMQRRLWVPRLEGEWIELKVPSVLDGSRWQASIQG